MFRQRSQEDIIGDCLKVMQDHDCMPIDLKTVWKKAKVTGWRMQMRYAEILKKTNMALIKDGKGTITNRGIKYLTFYKAINDLLRSGFQSTGATFA